MCSPLRETELSLMLVKYPNIVVTPKLGPGNDLTFHTDLKGPRTVSYRMFITTVWYEFVSIITVWPVSVKIGGEKPL